jgi:arylsulfatase
MLACCFGSLLLAAETKKTNVVILLVDDMGYSDPGYMGGEAKTPHLNQLAKDGATFTNTFNNAKCAPSRAALMTGMACQRVKAFKSKGDISANNATSIAEVLGEQGYCTILSGKWHVAPDPLDIGFQHFHGVNIAPYFFKRDVVKASAGKKNGNPLWMNREMVDPQVLPDDWYSTTAYTDFAIETIEKEALSKNKPFFLYLAVNAPHFPFEAPKEVIDEYLDAYDEGTDAIRLKRYQRLVDMGVIDPDALALPPLVSNDKDGEMDWSKLSPKEQMFFKRKLAIIAAMVDMVDQETGKLVDYLKSHDQFENTLFIFLSDNGATAEQGRYGGSDFDNMTEADIALMGTREGVDGGSSGALIGALQNTPYRGHKTTLWDGGMHTSMIVHWPQGMKPSVADGYLKTPISIYDIAPTIYDATQIAYPSSIKDRPLQDMDGISFLPLLRGQNLPERQLFFSYKSHRVVRDDNFKLFGEYKKGRTSWALYDMKNDQSEGVNVMGERPEVAREMIQAWEAFDQDAGITEGTDAFFKVLLAKKAEKKKLEKSSNKNNSKKKDSKKKIPREKTKK